MDPNLYELLEGDPDDEVAALIRLRDAETAPAGVRIVTRFGNVATCRLRRSAILETRIAEDVLSLKAPQFVTPEPEPDGLDLELDFEEGAHTHDERRPASLAETGRGTVIGVVDWGIDFGHSDFRRPDGTTRLLAIWDQRGGPRPASPAPYGYGAVYTAEQINRALQARDPYAALGYHPADADIDRNGTHGSHVLGITAGNGRAGGPAGIAPGADLVFVHMDATGTAAPANLGDSVSLPEAVDFIFRVAEARPCVINLSLGRHWGSHDGTSLVEQALDAALTTVPGRAICQSGGNYYERRIHAAGQLRPGEVRTLRWETDEADLTRNELEVWYSHRDRLGIEVEAPDGTRSRRVGLDDRETVRVNGRVVCRVYQRANEPNNLDHHINVFVYPHGPAGTWTVRLFGEDVVDGRFHAWIERDAACRGCQSTFSPRDADPATTTGSICNGLRTIAVGAYNGHAADRRLAPFSSSGPTRDGRVKPDLVAPGVGVLAARSARREGATPLLTRKSGTSMASPHVAGTIACMFEAAGRPLPIETTRRLLLESTDASGRTAETVDRIGSGYLDIEAAVAAARRLRRGPAGVALREGGEDAMNAPERELADLPAHTHGAWERTAEHVDRAMPVVEAASWETLEAELSPEDEAELLEAEAHEVNLYVDAVLDAEAVDAEGGRPDPPGRAAVLPEQTDADGPEAIEVFEIEDFADSEGLEHEADELDETALTLASGDAAGSFVAAADLPGLVEADEAGCVPCGQESVNVYETDWAVADTVPAEALEWEGAGPEADEQAAAAREADEGETLEAERMSWEVADDWEAADDWQAAEEPNTAGITPADGAYRSPGLAFVETADHLIATAPGRSGLLLSALVARAPAVESLIPGGAGEVPSPARLFGLLAAGYAGAGEAAFADLFEVVGPPGGRLREDVQEGDILVRRMPGEPDSGHLAVIVGPELWRDDELAGADMRAEPRGPGRYARVIEGGPFPHRLEDAYARLVVDAAGRVPPHQMIVRPAAMMLEAAGQAGIATVEAAIPEAAMPAAGGRQPDRSTPCAGELVLLDGFAHESTALTPAHRAVIAGIAGRVARGLAGPDPVHTLCLIGHTDASGTAAYNLEFGRQRADAVRQELVQALDRERPGLSGQLTITVGSEGETRPVAPEGTPEGRARNRRVEVRLNNRCLPVGPPVAVAWARMRPGGGPSGREDVESAEVAPRPEERMRVGRTCTFLGRGGPHPGGVPAYTYTSSEPGVVSIHQPDTQADPNPVAITCTKPGRTTVTMTRLDNRGNRATDSVDIVCVPRRSGLTNAVVPVIIVPGIMGSRLVDPATSALVWNPTGQPIGRPCTGSYGRFAANRDRLMDPAPLRPAESHDIPGWRCRDRFTRAEAIPHFGNLVADFYDQLAFALNDPAFNAGLRGRTGKALQVLACGYDWRDDNAESARRLRQVVDEAKRLPGVGCDGKVIIIAHSMGGLVSRFFCKMLGGEADTDALILLGSPTHGAPQAYRTLKTGISLWIDTLLSALFPASSRATLMRMLRGFPSAYQLLPTRHYARHHPDWLEFERTRGAPLTDASDADDVYAHAHTGFLDGQNGGAALERRVRRALALRTRFDTALFDPTAGCYMPDPTFIFLASDLPTELRYRLEGGGGRAFDVRVLRSAPDGDQTVPTFSASADGCGHVTLRRDTRTVKHDALPNNPAVIDGVKAIIERRLRPTPALPPAAPVPRTPVPV